MKNQTNFAINRKTINNALFFLSVFFLCFNLILYNGLGLVGLKLYLRLLSIMCSVVYVLFNIEKISVKLEVLYIYIIVVSFFQIIYSDLALNVLSIVLIMLMVRSMDFECLKKHMIVVSIVLFIIWALLMRLGYISNSPYIIGGRIRYTLGFSNVNTGAIFLYSILTVLVVCIKKAPIIRMIALVVGTFVIYSITDTRSILFCTVFFFLFIILFNVIKNKQILRFAINISIAVIIGVSLFSPLLYKYFPAVDKVLSGRLAFFANFVQTEGIWKFLFGGSTVEIDNFYLNSFLGYGVVIFGPMLYFVLKKIGYLINNIKDYILIAMLIAYLAVGVVEGSLSRPEFLMSFFFWCQISVRNVDSVAKHSNSLINDN